MFPVIWVKSEIQQTNATIQHFAMQTTPNFSLPPHQLFVTICAPASFTHDSYTLHRAMNESNNPVL